MTIRLAYPHEGVVRHEFMWSVLRLLSARDDVQIDWWGPCNHNDVALGRSSLVWRMLQEPDDTHLLFADTDQVFTPDDFTRLLGHDLPVVAGVAVAEDRQLKWKPLDGEPPEGRTGLHEAEYVGCGFMLIKRDVLEAVGEWPFRQGLDPQSQGSIGTDVYFCRTARAAGFAVWADADVKIGHIKPQVLYPE